MKYRKLRIAWSVAWGVVAVLLCVLWVRSYRVGGYLRVPIGSRNFYVVAEGGELEILLFQFVLDDGWAYGLRDPKESNVTSIADVLGFRILYVANFYSGVTLPYWAALVTCAGLAAATWTRRFSKFSLRTLLIATTLVAVVLGLVVWLA